MTIEQVGETFIQNVPIVPARRHNHADFHRVERHIGDTGGAPVTH
jgi:hypothetical protein